MRFAVGSSILFSEDDAIFILDDPKFDGYNKRLYDEFPYAKPSDKGKEKKGDKGKVTQDGKGKSGGKGEDKKGEGDVILRKPKYSKATITVKKGGKTVSDIYRSLRGLDFQSVSLFNYKFEGLYEMCNKLEKDCGKKVTIYSTENTRGKIVFNGGESDGGSGDGSSAEGGDKELFDHFPHKGLWGEFADAVFPEGSVNDEIVKINKLYSEEIEEYEVYPPIKDVFKAFALTSVSDIKVVILGQDPYHGEGEAMGLAFSVAPGVPLPPTLKNIFKEFETEGFGKRKAGDGNLTYLAEQGVFLINTALTVRGNNANSHSKWWSTFTNFLMSYLSENTTNVVYILLGRHAQSYKPILDKNNDNFVLETSHPSPLGASKGFIGSGIFKQCNECLQQMGREPIKW